MAHQTNSIQNKSILSQFFCGYIQSFVCYKPSVNIVIAYEINSNIHLIFKQMHFKKQKVRWIGC